MCSLRQACDCQGKGLRHKQDLLGKAVSRLVQVEFQYHLCPLVLAAFTA